MGHGIFEGLNEAKPIVVKAVKLTIALNHNGVDSAHSLGQRIDMVHELHGPHLVWNGHGAPGNAQRHQAAQCSFNRLGLHRKQTVSALQAVARYPMIVDER